jgi:hypothetical protein
LGEQAFLVHRLYRGVPEWLDLNQEIFLVQRHTPDYVSYYVGINRNETGDLGHAAG